MKSKKLFNRLNNCFVLNQWWRGSWTPPLLAEIRKILSCKRAERFISCDSNHCRMRRNLFIFSLLKTILPSGSSLQKATNSQCFPLHSGRQKCSSDCCTLPWGTQWGDSGPEPAWPTLTLMGSEEQQGLDWQGAILLLSCHRALLVQLSQAWGFSPVPSLAQCQALSLPRVPNRISYTITTCWNWDRADHLEFKPAPRDSRGANGEGHKSVHVWWGMFPFS